MPNGVTITWLGHGTFLFTSATGKRIVLDPWIEGNPKFPEAWREKITQDIDLLLITHGHFDHTGDVLTVAKQTSAKVGCIYETAAWLQSQGVNEDQVVGFNKGGSAELAGLKVTMTDARHSGGHVADTSITYLGDPCGFILEFENGFKVYHTGDTSIFSDMQLLGELYQPDLVILPIGDFYTMGPFQAAHALRLIKPRFAIPEHYGTFPALPGTPEALQSHLQELHVSTELVVLEPGQTWQQS